VVPSAIR